jgi:cell division protein FtsL
MVKNDKYQKHYTYGNVAYEIQPQINHEEKVKKKIKKNTKAEINIKLKMMGLIGMLTVCSFLLLCRFAQINTLTGNLRSLKSDIKSVQKENENLEVQIARVNNIKDIESKAVSTYGMVVPDKSAVVYIDIKQFASNEEKNVKKASAFESVQRLLGLIY